MGWKPFNTAPRTGEWFLAYRESPKSDNQHRWCTLVLMMWDEDRRKFIWPSDGAMVDPYAEHESWRDYQWAEDGRCFYVGPKDKKFTHWRPVPRKP